MKWSRNPGSGELEAYTDEGKFIGIVSTMGDEVKKQTATDEFREQDHPRDKTGKFTSGNGTKGENVEKGIEKKWNNETEYRKAVAEAESTYNERAKELRGMEKDFIKKEQQINDEAEIKRNEVNKRVDAGELSLDKALNEWDAINREARDKIAEEKQKIADFSSKRISDYVTVFDPEYEFPKLEGKHEPVLGEEREIVNPKGLSNNCQRCCIAEEMRYRGYDVIVTEGSKVSHSYDGLSDLNAVSGCFVLDNPKEDVKAFDISQYGNYNECMQTQMKEWGDGARALAWYDSPDECHLYNLINDNGRIICVDAMTGLVCDDKTNDKVFLGVPDNATMSGLIRVDKAKPTSDTKLYCQGRNTDESA